MIFPAVRLESRVTTLHLILRMTTEPDGGARAVRTAPPSEEEVKRWLVEHYSHVSKMRRDRMSLLLEQKPTYAFLRTPLKVAKLYRGLHNVTRQTLEKLKRGETTDEVKDKSWTSSKSVAWRFAKGEFNSEDSIDGRFAVVLTAPIETDKALLNAALAATEPGIGDQYNEIWGETLENAIRNEQEVLINGSLTVNKVDSEALEAPSRASMTIFADYEDGYDMYDGVSPRMEGKTLFIPIMDTIGDSWWGSSVSAKSIKKALAQHADAEHIVLEINSPGGDVHEGNAIYGFLRAAKKVAGRSDRTIEARVFGLAASMASVIMLAADKRVMLPGSMVMIHEPWTIAYGGAGDFSKIADRLETISGSMVKIYADRTGGSESVLRAQMAEETWFSADEAVNAGFAEEVVDGADLEVPQSLAASAEWNDRRGALLSMFKRADDYVEPGTKLGWSGSSRDELVAVMAMAKTKRPPSFDAAVAMVRGQPGPAPKSAGHSKPHAQSAAPEIGTLRLEVPVQDHAQPTKAAETPVPDIAQASAIDLQHEKKKTMDEEQIKAFAAELDLPVGSTIEDIKAALADGKAQREKDKADLAAAKASAEKAEMDRMTTEAKSAAAVAMAEQARQVERRVFERASYDTETQTFLAGLPPALAKSMGALCYEAVEASVHPSGKVPKPAGLEAAKLAIAEMPELTKAHYSGANADLETAKAAAASGTTPATGGQSIFEVFPQIAPEDFQAHHAKLVARKSRMTRRDVNFTA